MFNVGFQLINGMMLGLEFPTAIPKDELDEDDPEITFSVVLDLLIIRILIFKVKDE